MRSRIPLALCALSLVAGCPRVRVDGAPNDLAIRSDGSPPIADLAQPPSDLSRPAPADLAPSAPADLAQSAPADLAQPGGTLDPGLSLPDPSGPACNTPGSLGECPFLDVCRFYSPQQGRCESCTTCNNLGAACSASSDCDILFMCYLGRCTNFCTLGTTECGAPADCLNIGHPTKGVCK